MNVILRIQLFQISQNTFCKYTSLKTPGNLKLTSGGRKKPCCPLRTPQMTSLISKSWRSWRKNIQNLNIWWQMMWTWYLNPKFLSQACKLVKLAGTSPFLQCLKSKISFTHCSVIFFSSFSGAISEYIIKLWKNSKLFSSSLPLFKKLKSCGGGGGD